MTEKSFGAVDVKYTLGDLYAVTFRSWRGHVVSIAILPGAVIGVLLLLALIADLDLVYALAVFPWEFLVGLIALIFALRFGLNPFLAYLNSRRVAQTGPYSFELTDEGVRLRSSDGSALIYWTAIKRVEASDSRLFLFTDRATAFVLPQRAFPDVATFNSAIEHAKSQWVAPKK